MFEILSNRKVATAACVSFVALALLLLPVSLVSGENSDFALSANPPTLCVNPGINAVSVISLSSEGGFAGTVSLAGSVSPSYTNSPRLSPIPRTETLTSGQTISFEVTISTTRVTPLYVYYITISGLAGSSLHQANIQLTVGSGCSVGGTILPIDRLSLSSPYLTLGAFGAAAMIGLAVTALVYRSRRQRE